MRRLSVYLKPFIPLIILALSLLFVIVMCDLNLPNMMSNIVNKGIQQGGIEHAAPDAISPEGLALARFYMTQPDNQLTERCYIRAGFNELNEKGKTYQSLYPGMGDAVYVLHKAVTKQERERLDEAFGRAAYLFIARLQSMAAGADNGGQAGGVDYELDIAAAYRIQAMLAASPVPYTPPETDSLSGAYAGQTGALLAKAFYKELGVDTGAMQSGYIIKIGLYMLGIVLLSAACNVLVGLLAPRISAGAARNLRRDVFEKVENFSQREFDKFSSASLITRCTNDISQVQMMVGMGLRMLCSAPIMGVGGIIMALRKSVSMSWIIALAVVVLIGLVMVVMSVALPKFKIIQSLVDKLNKVARENLNGLMVIRAFGTQKHETERFAAANRELTDVNLFVQRVMAVVFPFISFIMSGITLLIVWAGAHQIADSALQIGDMMAFMQYAVQVVMSFMMISMMFIFVPRAVVSADRITEVLDTELSVTDPEEPKTFNPALKGAVEFKNVCFRYDNAEEDALSEISFTANSGQTTAIIGATGAGKSTLVNLLMRFYDVTGGQITVDGVDVREVKQRDLRAIIGYVPQKGVLLSGTVASNIRYGRPDASDAEVESAAAVAQAEEFIAQMPGLFESEISQGGANVSGGQKQRLSIARALAKRPEILVFDDSFSALDFKTDAALRRALKEHTADATVIVVAQRVGTIMNAERIIVLDEGRIAGIGTHNELLKTCPAYYEIASSQLAERLEGGVTA